MSVVATSLLSHFAGCLAVALLLGVPGWAAIELLGLRRHVPRLGLAPAAAVLGLGLVALDLPVVLTAGLGSTELLWLHGAATTVLVVLAALRAARRRGGGASRPNHAVAIGGDLLGRIEPWSIAGIAACAVLAELVRTRLAFDSLFHLGLVRRIAELDSLHWDSLDRTAGGGVNPSYLVPAWQAVLAMASRITGLDPTAIVEGIAVLLVVLAACAAGALGRVVAGSGAGEVAGVAAYALLRVWYPRREREGDGVVYAFLPGNVALDIVFPLMLVAALLLAAGTMSRRGLRGPAWFGAIAAALFVLLHANYVVYLAIVGAGLAVWLAVACRPLAPGTWRGVVRAATWLAVPAAAVLAALLPVLMTLENFARDHEARSSIDYYLVGDGAWQVIRPSHLYELAGMPGLVAIVLLVPIAAWAGRTPVVRALVGGGVLGVFAVSFVPPLLALLGSTGSLTIGLRMHRLLDVLFVAAAGVAVPVLVEAWRRRHRMARTRMRAWAWLGAPLVTIAVASAAFGYPRVRLDPPEFGWTWPTVVGCAALVAVLVRSARGRRSRAASAALPAAGVVGAVVVVVAAAMLPSGAQSMRRAAWHVQAWNAPRTSDDLACYAGIEGALAALPPSAVVLADPVTSYGIPALAPGYVVADFKVWNGETDESPAQHRIERMVEAWSDDDDAGRAFLRLVESERPTHVVYATGATQPPEGSDDDHVYDSTAVREVLLDHPAAFPLVEEGPGRGIVGDLRERCALHLHRVVVDELPDGDSVPTNLGIVTVWPPPPGCDSPTVVRLAYSPEVGCQITFGTKKEVES